MEELLFRALQMLFKDYEQYGNYNEKEVQKLIALIFIRDMLMFDFEGFLEDKDIRDIEKAVNCLLGESCILQICINQKC